MSLSTDQHAALGQVLAFLADTKYKEMALAGPAGSGKTYLTEHILAAARGQKHKLLRLLVGKTNQFNVLLTSTTNKAATVLAEATGEEVITIHRALGLRVQRNYSTGVEELIPNDNAKPIQNMFIVIDEASMINEHLLNVIRKNTFQCKILYILDEYQLGPVKEQDIPVIKNVSNIVRLTTIQRQAEGNSIIECAKGFREAQDTGYFPLLQSMGSEVQQVTGAEFKAAIDHSFSRFDGGNENRILCWTNNRVHAYNDYIRKLRGLPPEFQQGEVVIVNEAIVQRETVFYRTDQLVTITHVTPDIKFGIEGWYVELNFNNTFFLPADKIKTNKMKKKFQKEKNWKDFYKIKDTFVDLRPSYSSTVTKAQGSTYGTAFIDVRDIARNPNKMEMARMMYTAITRASDKIYLCGTLPPRVYV